MLTLALVCLIPTMYAQAQDDRTNYTGNNTIMVSLEGLDQRYEFISKQMLVRLNKKTQTIECVLPVASLLPVRAGIPPAMAYEVLFGAKYPELVISIWLPTRNAGTTSLTPFNEDRTASITLQGVNNETVIPVAVLPDADQAVYFSTNFDLMLDNFEASLPAKYLPLLTGRVMLSINKAYWYNLGVR